MILLCLRKFLKRKDFSLSIRSDKRKYFVDYYRDKISRCRNYNAKVAQYEICTVFCACSRMKKNSSFSVTDRNSNHMYGKFYE